MNDQPTTTAHDPDVTAASSELMELKPLRVNSQYKPTHKVNRTDLTNDYNLMLTTAQQLQGEVNHWHAATINANEIVVGQRKIIASNKAVINRGQDEIRDAKQTIRNLKAEEANSRRGLSVIIIAIILAFALGLLSPLLIALVWG